MKKYDKVMMQTAKLWSKMSYCKRRQVGAVLAKNGRILVTGYNGTLSGKKNQCENYICPHCHTKKDKLSDLANINKYYTGIAPDIKTKKIKYTCKFCGKKIKDPLKTDDFTLHAEQNIITYAAKKGIKTKNCDIYITTSPCKQCAKLIAASGIKRVIYLEKYKDIEGIEFLKKARVKVKKAEV